MDTALKSFIKNNNLLTKGTVECKFTVNFTLVLCLQVLQQLLSIDAVCRNWNWDRFMYFRSKTSTKTHISSCNACLRIIRMFNIYRKFIFCAAIFLRGTGPSKRIKVWLRNSVQHNTGCQHRTLQTIITQAKQYFIHLVYMWMHYNDA